jgi:hypothetical protein
MTDFLSLSDQQARALALLLSWKTRALVYRWTAVPRESAASPRRLAICRDVER